MGLPKANPIHASLDILSIPIVEQGGGGGYAVICERKYFLNGPSYYTVNAYNDRKTRTKWPISWKNPGKRLCYIIDFFAASFTTHTYTLKFRLEPPWFLNQWYVFCLIISIHNGSITQIFLRRFPRWVLFSPGWKQNCDLWNDWWLGQVIYQTKAIVITT